MAKIFTGQLVFKALIVPNYGYEKLGKALRNGEICSKRNKSVRFASQPDLGWSTEIKELGLLRFWD